MAFTIRPAKRTDSKLLLGLYARSGAGKTYSALLLARGIVGPKGRIVLIDTESGRGSLYADVISGGYNVIELEAPFSPARYLQAFEEAEKNADVIIIDSCSHEWEGIGGVCDMAEGSGKKGLLAWKEPKSQHQKLLLTYLRSKCHVICCLRAKQKSRQLTVNGKTEIVKDEHHTPKQDHDFIFEMMVHAEILDNHTLRVTKVSHPALAAIFRDGIVISEETGRQVAAWATGKPIARADVIAEDLIVQVRSCTSHDALEKILKGEQPKKQIEWLEKNRADLYERLDSAVTAKCEELDGGTMSAPSGGQDDGAREGEEASSSTGGISIPEASGRLAGDPP